MNSIIMNDLLLNNTGRVVLSPPLKGSNRIKQGIFDSNNFRMRIPDKDFS